MLHTLKNKFLLFCEKNPRIGIETILKILAVIIITSLFLKAIIDVDVAYDSWWYHLPFAAKIWRIVPPEFFLGDEKWFIPRFEGFPLLAHFLQGFFWFITGRVQCANLVSFSSLIIYLFFLKTNFQVPLYLSTIALLAIPLVLTHSTSSLVDLPGNIGFSILLLIAYKLFKQKQLPKKQELLIAILAAATAANIKTHLQILVLATACIFLARLTWLYFNQTKILDKQLFRFVLIGTLAFLLIFATPAKNTIIYGNPLYPVKIEVAGIVLNHKLTPEAFGNEEHRGQKWLNSILEIKSAPWSTEQGSSEPSRNRMGGFFGAYVIFNLLLLLGLSIHELLSKDTQLLKARTALVAITIASIITAYFPQSYELRYTMFWMITLVSLNLHLISISRSSHTNKMLQPRYLGLIYAIFLIFVLSTIHGIYIKPSFQSLEKQISQGVKPELLSKIKPGEQVCLLSKHVEFPQQVPMAALQYVFLYSSYFHPELDYSYSVKAAFNPESCGERRILPAPKK